MNQATFTTNPQRIARLEFNYHEGAKREKMPTAEREKMDQKLLNVSPAYLNQLFANVAAIRKAKTAAPAQAQLAVA